ncbi:SPOSA6832_01905, partial [Sporobolomyces salmonicolor]
MSSQKDKASASKSTGQQSTLFSFFSKPKSDPATSSPAARPPARKPQLDTLKTPQARSSNASTPHTSGSSSGGAVKSTPATSEGDGLMLDDDDDEEEEEERQSARVKVPAKRSAAVSDDEEEDADRVLVRKRLSLGGKNSRAKVIDSEEDDEGDVEVISPKKKAPAKKAERGKSTTTGRGKAKKKSQDDDDFSVGSGSDSEDYFNDDLDDFLASASDDAVSVASSSSSPKLKAKSKPKAKAAPAKSKPSVVQQSSPSGFGTPRPPLKSSAVDSKEKQQKKANEAMYSFLVKPKDADGIPHGTPGSDPRTLHIPASAWMTFTPFEKQFWEIKQNHYDTVLFFQKGKFFELRIGHREFDLKLTDRVKMAMVGVPETSFDFWAAKSDDPFPIQFLAQGHKVGRVDQAETALGAEIRNKDAKAAGGKAKGKASGGKEIVRRELKSVLTTGTIVDGSMLTDDMSNHCVAIKEDTPTPASLPSFGVCVLDASTAEFSLSYFADDVSRTQLETLVRQLKPKEVIHQKGNLSVSTLRLLRNCLGIDCQWTALKEGKEFLHAEDAREEVVKLFKEAKNKGKGGDEKGMEVDEEADEETLVPEDIRKMYDKPVALSALGGLIWSGCSLLPSPYCQGAHSLRVNRYLRQLNLDSELVTAKNFNIYDPLARGKALVLDGQTLAHIEVLQNSQGGTEGTLFQLLSRCVTPFGKRLFKVWLCAPLRDAAGINDRQDLLGNPNFAVTFDSMAKKLPDLERMLSRVHAKTCKKADFLSEDFKSAGIPSLLRNAPDISTLLEEIKELYEGDELLPVEGKDEEYEASLSLLRVRLNVEEIEEALQDELEKAQKQFKDSSIAFKNIGTKDIFQVWRLFPTAIVTIEVPVKHKVPGNWTKMTSTQKVNRYYSPEVAKLVSQLKEARERKGMFVNSFQFKACAPSSSFRENNR